MERRDIIAGEWQKLRELLALPWFRRRWILQEVLHTPEKDRTIWLGDIEVPWSHLRKILDIGGLTNQTGTSLRFILDSTNIAT